MSDNDQESRLTPMERRALERLDAHTRKLRAMSDNEHVTAIRLLCTIEEPEGSFFSKHDLNAILNHAEALERQIAEAEARADLAEQRLAAAIDFLQGRSGGVIVRDNIFNGDLDTPGDLDAEPKTEGGSITLRVTDVRQGTFRPIEDDEIEWQPTLASMIGDLIRNDVELTISMDGAYGSGAVQISSKRPRYRDGEVVSVNRDYTQGETIAECVDAAWHCWMATIREHGANVPPGNTEGGDDATHDG